MANKQAKQEAVDSAIASAPSILLRIIPSANSGPSLLSVASAASGPRAGAKTSVSVLNASDLQIKKTFVFNHAGTANRPESDAYFINNLKFDEIVDAVFGGKNVGVFCASVGKCISQKERVRYFNDIVSMLSGKSANADITFGYFGITDSKLIDLTTEKTIHESRISHDLSSLLSKIENFSKVDEVLSRECNLPTLFCFRVESKQTPRTLGTLYLTDMATPCFLPPTDASYTYSGASITKSLCAIRKIAGLLTTPGYTGVIPYRESIFTTICSNFLGRNGHGVFILNIDPTDKHKAVENENAIELWHSLKKITSLETAVYSDHRIPILETQCAQLEQDLESFQKLSQSQSEAIATSSARINNLEIDLQETRRSTMDEIESLKQHHSQLMTEARKNQISAVDQTVDRYEKHVKALLEKFDAEKANLVKDFENEIKIELDAAENEKEALITKISELQDIIDKGVLTAMDLRDSLTKEMVKTANLDESLARASLEKSNLQEKIAATINEFDELGKAHSTAIALLNARQSQIETMVKQNTSLESRLAATHEKLNNNTITAEKTSSELKVALELIEKLKAEKQATEAEAQKYIKDAKESFKSEYSVLEAKLVAKHKSELNELSATHESEMRTLKKQISRAGMEKTNEAQSRIEMETEIEELKRAHARDLERIKRKARAEIDENVKDLEVKLEEAEQIGSGWKRDCERLQKALQRAVEMGKNSLEEFEKEVDSERDLWDAEKRSLKARIQSLEIRLATISETLKIANENQMSGLAAEVHKSIMSAAQVQPTAPEPEKKTVARRRARMSDEVTSLLKLSQTVGQDIPTKSKPLNVAIVSQRDSSVEAETHVLVPETQPDSESEALSISKTNPRAKPVKRIEKQQNETCIQDTEFNGVGTENRLVDPVATYESSEIEEKELSRASIHRAKPKSTISEAATKQKSKNDTFDNHDDSDYASDEGVKPSSKSRKKAVKAASLTAANKQNEISADDPPRAKSTKETKNKHYSNNADESGNKVGDIAVEEQSREEAGVLQKENKKENKKRKPAAPKITTECANKEDDSLAKKIKLVGKATMVDDEEKLKIVSQNPSKAGGLGLSVPKSPLKKPLFSFSKPSLSTLTGFGGIAGGYTVGTSVNSGALSEFEKARAMRQGQKRLDALMAAQPQDQRNNH